MSTWLSSQRLSLRAVAAELAKRGYGEEIAPTLKRGEEMTDRRHLFVAGHKAQFEEQRLKELQREHYRGK